MWIAIPIAFAVVIVAAVVYAIVRDVKKEKDAAWLQYDDAPPLHWASTDLPLHV